MTADPWTIYWQADNRDSCIATAVPDDAEQIAALWRDFAGCLADGGMVLDLATGNGTVPAALLAGNPTLKITGVDRAEINPLQFLSAPGPLHGVTFMGSVDVCSLPFDADSFDAVTSQFGIEYADFDRSLPEAARVIRAGGRLAFMMHHVDSAVVLPAQSRLQEMQGLLQSGGVVELLSAFVAGDRAFAELDAAGKRHLDGAVERTAGVTGQIFEGVRTAVRLLQAGRAGEARELSSTMSLRLRADRDRLRQLAAAAQDATQFGRTANRLRQLGLDVDVAAEWHLPESSGTTTLLGWQLMCTKQ